MKLEFDKMEEMKLPAFKGGAGELIARMQVDELGKRMYGRLPVGASIGYHKHETNSETIYILSGTAKCLYDDGEEMLTKGDCHYCPMGHSHSLINAGEDELVFFAVIPEQKQPAEAAFYKSMADQDRSAVVICNLEHEIIYMNCAAVKNYEKWGGEALIGKSLLDCHNPQSCEKIKQVLAWFKESEENQLVYTFHNEKQNKDVYMVALRDNGTLIGYYEKHEFRNRETMNLYDI